MTHSSHEHAVVIGGSIAGLLTAAALHDHFETITVLDRDTLPVVPAHRKGTPQARHTHTYWMAGLQAVEQLLPGFEADLVGAGAQQVDLPSDLRWLTPAGWVGPFAATARLLPASRPLLEWTIRANVSRLERVTVLSAHEVTGLRHDRNGGITGVTARTRGTAATQELGADLVVDASGRGSALPDWLAQLGVRRPAESTVDGHLGYASRLFAVPPGPKPWKAMYIQAAPPTHCRGGILFPIENDLWVVSLIGGGGDYPPTDDYGFLAFARSLRSPELYDVLRTAEPRSPIWGYRRAANHRRHYERLKEMPAGLLALGDSLCAFNPVYGQGMTVAALQAGRLAHLLEQGEGRRRGFTHRAQRTLSRIADDAWMVSTGEDMRYPNADGARATLQIRLTHRYLDRVVAAATTDPVVNASLLQVFNLLDRPHALFAPRTLTRVLLGTRRAGPARAADRDVALAPLPQSARERSAVTGVPQITAP